MPNDPSTAPEGPSRPVRRRFSEREKLRILDAADACTRPGEIGLLLRREGIYTSHLANWRRWRMCARVDTLIPSELVGVPTRGRARAALPRKGGTQDGSAAL